ncbi:MAG TPA: hypothetical protein VK689_02195, partial [Armatimonadota bacterium]|nr:hypothetical protein [Armatimonadota bacterium]
LAAAGAAGLLRRVGIPPRALPTAGVALALAWSIGSHWGIYRDAALHAAGLRSRAHWLARFRTGRDYSFAANARVAQYVAATTRPGTGLLVWGFEPSVYLLAERRPPTRFFFNVPLAAPFTPESWRAELLADLRHRPPELFLVVRNDAIPWASGRRDDSAAQLEGWTELSRWLAANYRLETHVEDFDIYRRVPVR